MNKWLSASALLLVSTMAFTAWIVKDHDSHSDDIYCEEPGSTTCTHKVSYRTDPSCSQPHPCPGATTPHILRNDSCIEIAPEAHLCIIVEKGK